MACVVCGGQVFSVVLDHQGRVMTSDRRVVAGALVKERCQGCGALRTRPGTALADARAFYETEYEQNSEPNKFGYVTAQGVVPRAQVEWEAVLRLRAPHAGERWLEIGCGAGDVLALLAAEAPGVEAVGVELAARAAAHAAARGLSVRQGGLEAVEGRFDVIYAIGVLEHVPDPRAFVQTAAARLRPDGALILALPDLATPSFDAWFVDHLHHFAAAHVQRLCADAGLVGFADHWRPVQTPHFMYLCATAGPPASPPALPVGPPACLDQWRAALVTVADTLQRYPRVGFLGASETAAFLLTYAVPGNGPRPLLFDDTCPARDERYGCPLRPGAELSATPGPVDVVIVATVPAYYDYLRTTRLASLPVPAVYPLAPASVEPR